VGFGAAAGLLLGPGASAETLSSSENPTVRKTQSGLHFQVPADWPIEERGGIVGPIPIEEYLGRKFSAVEARLRNLEQQLSAMEIRLRLLEEEAKKAKALQSSGPAAP
jgi:hypothetical protein